MNPPAAVVNTFWKVITLDRDAVQWDTRTLFGRTSCEEPMRAFAGVLFRTFIVRGEGGGQVLDALELAHADAANVVRVFKAKAGLPIAGPWAAYCRCFALPAIEDVTPRFRVTRDMVDLETPLVDLVRQGRVALPPRRRPRLRLLPQTSSSRSGCPTTERSS